MDADQQSGQNGESEEEAALSQMMMDLIGPYMADPEKLKLFFEESCFTDTVTTSSNAALAEAYASMAAPEDPGMGSMGSEPGHMNMTMNATEIGMEVMDMAALDTASQPISMTVCRPIGRQDETMLGCGF